MAIFKKIERQNLIEIYTKTYQFVQLKQYQGCTPPNSLSKEHALFAMRRKFQNLKKIILGPPSQILATLLRGESPIRQI